MADVKVHLYALVWNEMPILPFFLEHYRPFVSQFFLYDDGSDDGSAEYLSGQPDVVLRRFHNEGGSFVQNALRFNCEAWKASRGKADYVIVVNVDELVHHPQPMTALRQAKEEGLSLFQTRGWEMVGDALPLTGPLWKTLPRGVHSRAESKVAIFDPDAVVEINYGPGRHSARPQGRIVRPRRPLFDLLHYKYISADYLVDRYRQLRARMREGDRSAAYGVQYDKTEAELRAQHKRLRAAALPVLPRAMKAAGLLQEPRPGIFVYKLRQVTDDNPGLREIWRTDDSFGVIAEQAYSTTTPPNVATAWHIYRTRTNQITPVSGSGKLVLWDRRTAKKTSDAPIAIDMTAEDPALIVIPPGVWHGFQAHGQTPLVLLHLTDQPFDPVLTDETRLPPDDPSIPYRWPEST
jgi:dTDP-4-dehydrorhamnose 3,5-epimerase-like enzyme